MANSEDDVSGRIHTTPRSLTSEIGTKFDYIVCGAGTSGSVAAARLAANPDVRVLLLEAGGSDETHLVTNPNRWPMTLGTGLDWSFVAEPNPRLNGRAIPYSMGKVLGGGSSINVSTWSRGHQADWDYYAAESGDASWGYEAVLDLYRRRIEAWAGNADPDYRGSGGMVHVQPAADPHPFSFALLVGAESVGPQRFPSANGRLMESSGGCAFVDETVYQGTRRSIFRSYLHPRTANTNVTVVTGALVTRVLFDRRRATGIEFHCQGKNLRATAGCEVVLCLGAIQTPKLLMQSGIGDEDELRRAGIPLVHKLPAVGRHLHDHVAFGCVWESSGSPPPSAPRSQTVCFWKIDAALDAPDFYAFARRGPDVTPENAALLDLPADSWSFVIGMRPRSRGRVHLTGPDANDPVKIDANYLSDPDDLGNLMTGLDVARAIGNSVALRPFTAREIAPAARTDDELERFLRNGLGTFWHQCGTARMGRDENSVVDGRLKVHGLDGLRVADASILPRVTTGNTMAPCVVIGEQVAAFLQVTSS